MPDSEKKTYDSKIAEKANSQIAQNLKHLIKDAETANALRSKIKVTPQALSQYRLGTSLPKTENLLKIADFFEVSLDYLFGRTDVQSPDPNIQIVRNTTGLSEEATKTLQAFSCDELQVLNSVIISSHFRKMIQEIVKGGKYAGIQGNAIKAVIKNALSASPDKDIEALHPIINEDFDGLFRNGAINAAYKLYDEVSETIWEEAEKHGKH